MHPRLNVRDKVRLQGEYLMVTEEGGSYKAYEDGYNALCGTDTGWQADNQAKGGTYKALKLKGGWVAGGLIVTRKDAQLEGFIHFQSQKGTFT